MFEAADFVPCDFVVPLLLETPEFRLRMLSVEDVAQDFDAVMSSVEHLQNLFPGSDWPLGLTLAENRIDLSWHQKEFQLRRSFAYTVVDPAGARVLGCVYINPTRHQAYDAAVYLWVRADELAGGLESRLLSVVRDWVARCWPFVRAADPGRGIAWSVWNNQPSG